MRLLMQAALFAAVFLLALPVFAQDVILPDATAVVVPYGSWLDAVLANAQGIAVAALLGLIAVASRKAPSWLALIIKTLLTEQMLKWAVNFGINAVRGAVKGRSLSVDVGSQVVAEAIRYVIGKAPGWFLGWVGGAENLKAMILARLDMEAEADAATVLGAVRVEERAGGKPVITVKPGTVMPNGDRFVGRAS